MWIPLPPPLHQSVPWIFQWDNLPRKPSIRDAFNAGTIHHRMHSRKEAWKRWEERACACLFRAKKSLKRRGTVGSAAANPHNGRIVRNGSTNLRVIYVLITGLQRGRAPTYLFHRFQPRIMVLIMVERRTHACPSFAGGARISSFLPRSLSLPSASFEILIYNRSDNVIIRETWKLHISGRNRTIS